MRRGGSVDLLAALAVAGLAAGTFVPGGGASSKGSHATAHSTATTRVTVTATDSKFTLSKRSAPTGTVIFAVTNKGKISHDFKIAGKKTPLLSPRHAATLRVTFSKTGRYPYLSTVSGQASHGMKGVFSVVPAPPYTPPTGTVGTANTTVTVTLLDEPQGSIVLSQRTMPSGMVTFVITDRCIGSFCSFNLEGIKAGAHLDNVGESETWTVALPPGIYRYHCDASPTLMKGSFTVTR
jgi:plastocyanin